jgi:hypothetical protein
MQSKYAVNKKSEEREFPVFKRLEIKSFSPRRKSLWSIPEIALDTESAVKGIVR